MLACATEYKRSRPALGTFLRISLSPSRASPGEEVLERAVSLAFDEARRLERIFSAHHAKSALSLVNRAQPWVAVEVPSEFHCLQQFALEVDSASAGAFSAVLSPEGDSVRAPELYCQDGRHFVRKCSPSLLDLNGVAKGFIVDALVESLSRSLPGVAGVVDAGGDLRFFRRKSRFAHLRLGDPAAPMLRQVELPLDSLATSSVSASRYYENSSTRYSRRLRSGLTELHTAAVFADSCAVADALTKVALFGEPAVLASCAAQFGAQILVFSPDGALQEAYGAK